MSHEVYKVNDKNTVAITPEKLEQIKECMNSREGVEQGLLGMAIGIAITSFPLTFVRPKVSMNKITLAASAGALYGYVISKYFHVKACIARVLNDQNAQPYGNNLQLMEEHTLGVNIYENRKNKLENQELDKIEVSPRSTKESIFDVESPPQMRLLDEFPATNESADVSANKEPEKTVTYNELRQRNRDSYKSRNIVQKPIRIRDQSKEQSVQVKEFDTESKESDLFSEQSAGKHKTKYGDVWD